MGLVGTHTVHIPVDDAADQPFEGLGRRRPGIGGDGDTSGTTFDDSDSGSPVGEVVLVR